MSGISDQGLSIQSGASRIGWFTAGALSVVVLIGVYLLADGFFSQPGSAEVSAQTPAVIIEGY